jgi:alpha-tubulin suppressor-like RCC1 family protein
MVRSMAIAFVLAGCGARSDLPLTGTSPTQSPSQPGSVPDASSPPQVHALSLGYDASCALLTDGTARCWGNDFSGQFGDAPTRTPRTSPVALSEPTNIVALAVGSDHMCAVLSGGTLECWGADSDSQCGNGISPVMVGPTAIAGSAASVAAGDRCGCATRTDGQALCWGVAWGGPPSQDESTPTAMQGATSVVSISKNMFLTCGLLDDGGVICWGIAPLGDGTMNSSRDTPVRVQGLSHPVTQLAVGWRHACALLEDGTVQTWGFGDVGELGLGPNDTYAVLPRTVKGASPARAISSGPWGSCAVLTDGTVQCWGSVSSDPKGSYVPVAVPGITSAISVATGAGHNCALLASGKVVCWGGNSSGQLGDGTTTARAMPVEVTGLP